MELELSVRHCLDVFHEFGQLLTDVSVFQVREEGRRSLSRVTSLKHVSDLKKHQMRTRAPRVGPSLPIYCLNFDMTIEAESSRGEALCDYNTLCI